MERAPRKLGWWGCETSRGKRGTQTHDIGFQFPIVYTYTLQYLLHFDYEAFGKVSDCHNELKRALLTRMIHRSCKFDVTEMIRTFRHALTAGLALEIAVDGTHTRIHQSAYLRLVSSLVHDLWVLNFCRTPTNIMLSAKKKKHVQRCKNVVTHDFLG
jgi:hypothetical protein